MIKRNVLIEKLNSWKARENGVSIHLLKLISLVADGDNEEYSPLDEIKLVCDNRNNTPEIVGFTMEFIDDVLKNNK